MPLSREARGASSEIGLSSGFVILSKTTGDVPNDIPNAAPESLGIDKHRRYLRLGGNKVKRCPSCGTENRDEGGT